MDAKKKENANISNRRMAFYLPHRYEIEYDENRLQIGKEIGRRFLGIECEEHAVNAVADSVNISIVQSGNENGSGCGGESANTVPYDSTVTSSDIGCGDANARKQNQIKENTADEIILNCEKDELVLDVLNDDLIAKVRGRITSKLCATRRHPIVGAIIIYLLIHLFELTFYFGNLSFCSVLQWVVKNFLSHA